jgi:hypothetical protein
MQGWIKLHRKLIEWEWFHQPEMLLVFIYLLLKANHQDGNWQGVPVKKGQLITGRKRLSEETGLSEQKIRGCLNRLKSTSDITIKPTNRFSLITICNYCTYQPDVITVNQPINQPPNQQITNKQPTDNQQITTNNKVKKEKNVNTKTKKPLGFNSVPESSFKKLFIDELDPATQFEINTLNKYATKCHHKQDDLPNVYTYLIEEIVDLKEHCKVKRKGHDDLMRMFIASIKKEFKIV